MPPTYPSQPTLMLQQGSTIVQQPQVGQHQMYTVYINGNGTNQNLPQNPASSVTYSAFQPGQGTAERFFKSFLKIKCF